MLNNQRHDANHRPVAPIWRYNKLDPMSFGTRVRVDLRYGDEGWTPMILARITDVAFLFPPAAGAQLTLKGEDLLSLLKAKPASGHASTPTSHEIEMVEEELRAFDSDLSLASPQPTSPFSTPLRNVTHEKAKTYQQFIESLAERMDYRALRRVRRYRAHCRATAATRTSQPPLRAGAFGQLGDPITLRWGRDIVDFKPTFKVWDVLTEAVRERHVAARRGAFTPTVTMADAIERPACRARRRSRSRSPPSTARKRAFGPRTGPTSELRADHRHQSRRGARAAAGDGGAAQSARQFLTADITTIGFTELRPGHPRQPVRPLRRRSTASIT